MDFSLYMASIRSPPPAAPVPPSPSTSQFAVPPAARVWSGTGRQTWVSRGGCVLGEMDLDKREA